MANFYLVDKKYLEYLSFNGINAELVFKKAGIPLKALNKKDLYISREQYINLMNAIDDVVDTDDILSYTNVDNMITFIPPLFAAMCSKDGITCYNVISKYKKLIGPFLLKVHIDDEKLVVELTFDEEDIQLPKFTVFTEQTLLLSILRKATGERIIPRRITSRYDYEDKRFEEYFGIKPVIHSKNTVEFNIEDVKKPFLTENNIMWGFLEPELKKRIKELEIDNSFAANVRSILFELIPSGEGTIENVAKELDLSVRTLQRKLTGEKTTFLKQLNHTRELLARNYLKDRSMSNDDIAFLIGYSEANSFVRAFKNWTGMTITEYREKYS